MAVAEVVLKLLSLVLELVSHQEAKDLLDDAARRRVEAIADAAEAAKLAGLIP